jgi:hypothetical protein
MYNDDFEVKYFDIKNDLLNNLNTFRDEQLEQGEIQHKYNNEDIELICNKLYQDEYVSVFYADTIFDDKIDINMRKLYNLLMLNPLFKQTILNINIKLTNKYNINNEDNDYDFDYIIFMSLFKIEYFYLTHKLICMFLKYNIIDNHLLVLLETNLIQQDI